VSDPNRTVSAIPHNSATLPQPSERLQGAPLVLLNSLLITGRRVLISVLAYFSNSRTARFYVGCTVTCKTVTSVVTANVPLPTCNLLLLRSADVGMAGTEASSNPVNHGRICFPNPWLAYERRLLLAFSLHRQGPVTVGLSSRL
jgi:hypothetical protein